MDEGLQNSPASPEARPLKSSDEANGEGQQQPQQDESSVCADLDLARRAALTALSGLDRVLGSKGAPSSNSSGVAPSTSASSRARSGAASSFTGTSSTAPRASARTFQRSASSGSRSSGQQYYGGPVQGKQPHQQQAGQPFMLHFAQPCQTAVAAVLQQQQQVQALVGAGHAGLVDHPLLLRQHSMNGVMLRPLAAPFGAQTAMHTLQHPSSLPVLTQQHMQQQMIHHMGHGQPYLNPQAVTAISLPSMVQGQSPLPHALLPNSHGMAGLGMNQPQALWPHSAGLQQAPSPSPQQQQQQQQHFLNSHAAGPVAAMMQQAGGNGAHLPSVPEGLVTNSDLRTSFLASSMSLAAGGDLAGNALQAPAEPPPPPDSVLPELLDLFETDSWALAVAMRQGQGSREQEAQMQSEQQVLLAILDLLLLVARGELGLVSALAEGGPLQRVGAAVCQHLSDWPYPMTPPTALAMHAVAHAVAHLCPPTEAPELLQPLPELRVSCLTLLSALASREPEPPKLRNALASLQRHCRSSSHGDSNSSGGAGANSTLGQAQGPEAAAAAAGVALRALCDLQAVAKRNQALLRGAQNGWQVQAMLSPGAGGPGSSAPGPSSSSSSKPSSSGQLQVHSSPQQLLGGSIRVAFGNLGHSPGSITGAIPAAAGGAPGAAAAAAAAFAAAGAQDDLYDLAAASMSSACFMSPVSITALQSGGSVIAGGSEFVPRSLSAPSKAPGSTSAAGARPAPLQPPHVHPFQHGQYPQQPLLVETVGPGSQTGAEQLQQQLLQPGAPPLMHHPLWQQPAGPGSSVVQGRISGPGSLMHAGSVPEDVFTQQLSGSGLARSHSLLPLLRRSGSTAGAGYGASSDETSGASGTSSALLQLQLLRRSASSGYTSSATGAAAAVLASTPPLPTLDEGGPMPHLSQQQQQQQELQSQQQEQQHWLYRSSSGCGARDPGHRSSLPVSAGGATSALDNFGSMAQALQAAAAAAEECEGAAHLPTLDFRPLISRG